MHVGYQLTVLTAPSAPYPSGIHRCADSAPHINPMAALCLPTASPTARYRCYQRKQTFCSEHVVYVYPRSTPHMCLSASPHPKHVKRPRLCCEISHISCRVDLLLMRTVLWKVHPSSVPSQPHNTPLLENTR